MVKIIQLSVFSLAYCALAENTAASSEAVVGVASESCDAACLNAEIAAEPSPRKYMQMADMVMAIIDTTFDRKTIVHMMKNYGCHCFQEWPSVGGKGAPVDDKDRNCKKLSQCRSCIQMDYGTGDECSFQTRYKFDIDPVTKAISCDRTTMDCHRANCECDRQFAMDFAAEWDDANFNTFYWHNKNNMKHNPVFDIDATCVGGNKNLVNDECCGEYPSRRPFVSTVYECCSDGNVRGTGSCPAGP